MSKTTWLKKHYPNSALDFIFEKWEITQERAIEATEHSLAKWQGLLPKNLKKHNIKLFKNERFCGEPSLLDINEEGVLSIDGDSCALCKMFLDYANNGEYAECSNCPLAQMMGQTCNNSGSPWLSFLEDLDPEPMIKALERTLEALEKYELDYDE